jgi:hypothetical protein
MSEPEIEVLSDLRQYAPRIEHGDVPAGHEHHAQGIETVREDTYRGHRIVIRTTYEIEVDGRSVTGHIALTNDGRVHYHPMPNISFGSAVDMVKQLINAFPDDFPAPDGGDGHDEHDEHDGHGEHGGHG